MNDEYVDVEANVQPEPIKSSKRPYCALVFGGLLYIAYIVTNAFYAASHTGYTTIPIGADTDNATSQKAPPSFYFGILSAPSNIERRRQWRTGCGAYLRDAGYEFHFIIGRPSNDTRPTNNHLQGLLATPDEQRVTTDLLKESEQYQDIVFVPGRETYRDLTDKTLHTLEQGLRTSAQYIGKIDDDTCVEAESLAMLVTRNAHAASRMVYAGISLFEGTEYPSKQQGPHHEIAPYFAGPAYVLSRNLVKAIIIDERPYTYSYPLYGTSSEDTNVGKWVAHVKEKLYQDVTFDRIAERKQ